MSTGRGRVGAGDTLSTKLWAVANRLRPRVEAAEYKHVVLRIYSLHALSAKELEDRVILTPENSWKGLLKFIKNLEDGDKKKLEDGDENSIAIRLDECMMEISKSNKELEDCFPPLFQRLGLVNETLQPLIEGFDKLFEKFFDSGIVYQYFLRKFAELEGRRGGEYYTPECILELMVKMMNKREGTVYEPCFGGGSMILKIHQHSGVQNGKQRIKFYGQEANRTTFRMGKVHLFLHGIEADLKCGDTLKDDQHEFHADSSIANPPFNQEWEAKEDKSRWPHGTSPSKNANFAWIQQTLNHCGDKLDIISCLMSNGALSVQTGGEDDIRRAIIEADLVDCVVTLPDKLFSNTGIPASIWFFANKSDGKSRDRRGQTLFINARREGKMHTRTLRILPEDKISQIADTYLRWIGDESVQGSYQNKRGFCKSVKTEEISEERFIVTSGRYVGPPPRKPDPEAIGEKIERLTAELDSLFEESTHLEEEVRNNLRGFDIDN